MIVQHNLAAMNANRMFNITNNAKAKTTEKLSSGYRINRAADDAAGLAISEKMRRVIRGLNQGAENIQDGISLCQVADGALSTVDDILQRMNELSVQAANGTNSDEDREYIQEEIDQLVTEIDRIGETTSFNEIKIFDESEIENRMGKITSLVSSPSAESGRMAEAYQGTDGKYYTAASLDFSKIDASNIDRLNGASFSFTCPYGCGEKFIIDLSTNGTGSTAEGLIRSSNKHTYTVDISGLTTGQQVVDAIYSYVSSNLPIRALASSEAAALSGKVGGVGVSHRSALVKQGDTLYIIADKAFTTAEEAQSSDTRKSVDSSRLTSILSSDPVLLLPIQCSSAIDDIEYVQTRLINGNVLTISGLSVSTEDDAVNAIGKIKYGLSYVSKLRSEIGAQQNRLEHTLNNNKNVAENTTAAESQIRDTDMAKPW